MSLWDGLREREGRGQHPPRPEATPTPRLPRPQGPELAPRCLTLLVSDALPAQERFHN